MISNTLRHFSRRSALARRSVAQFHASAANNDDAKDAAPVDDSTGNDGIFGALFGNPYTSIPLCGLGVMSATATDVSALLSFFFFNYCQVPMDTTSLAPLKDVYFSDGRSLYMLYGNNPYSKPCLGYHTMDLMR